MKLVGSSKLRTLTFVKLKGKCYRCGSAHHQAFSCRHKETICRRCEKVGHIASVCLQKKTQLKMNYRQHQTENETNEESENEYVINANK